MRKAALEIKTDAFTGSKLGNVSQHKSLRDPKGRILKEKFVMASGKRYFVQNMVQISKL